ncbi:5-formyltetrahydrofolate cyclo-ligase [Simiduia agarivorans]|uniref:5-formyltetrahydrofolate cyclo-ligase n=1 Tax=Simiduia agarivorans (strain DSM 21679 / JCM 13881 / BCRC 17597 / SA1) TaxID=1117647 RepID=K4KLQ3_SIMAS|nr:5-formyltetrahydrofolate cyclo-ligase [Simiduia agarivorans]AFU99966.1 hypothetical protein M5M_14150 [Simiduia agarivorans SA1 = DSM 21679]
MTAYSDQIHAQRQSLRRELRARRRALPQRQQKSAALALAEHLHKHLWFARAKHVAFYLPADGELDPRPLLNLALAAGKHCYLPVVQKNGRLHFRRYRPGTMLRANRFGIPEPTASAPQRQPWLLQLVLLPLVGFDLCGGRLGMGGGYYDRTFCHRPGHPRPQGKRIGLAHSCQQVVRLPVASWDVPLHAIATEARLHAV